MKKCVRTIMTFLTALTLVTASCEAAVLSAETAAVSDTGSDTVKGKFKGGAVYTLNKGCGSLIIDGKGSFTEKEFDTLVKKNKPSILVFCKNVTVPKGTQTPNEWMLSILGNSAPYAVYMYKDSDIWVKYQEVINYVTVKAAADGKMLWRGYNADSMPVYTLEDEDDPYHEFDFSAGVAESRRKTVEYLVSNGIEEGRAGKIAGFYIMGLQRRIDTGNANEDGTEINEATLNAKWTSCLDCARCEQDLANSDEEFTNFDNPISKYLLEAGFAGDKNRELTQEYTTGTKMRLATETTVLQEETTIPSGSTDTMDDVISCRVELMREEIKKDKSEAPDEIVDEVLACYEKGLRLRMEEGLTTPEGEEANTLTKNTIRKNCCKAVNNLCRLKANMVDAERIEFTKKETEALKNTIASDYTLDTEDSKGKYLDMEGNFVKYTEFTENDGVLHDDVEYHYDPDTKGMYICGNGVFTEADGTNIEHGFDIKYYILGKDVKIGNTMLYYIDYDCSLWLVTQITGKERDVYFYQDSDAERLYEIYVKECLKPNMFSSTQLPYPPTRGKLLSYFAVTRLNDYTDPYTVLHGTSGITPTPKYSAKAVKDNTVIKAKPTLKGDADMNGEVGLSDIITVSKYIISNIGYPLINLTAMANADLNGDGYVDPIDISILIEVNLGIFSI